MTDTDLATNPDPEIPPLPADDPDREVVDTPDNGAEDEAELEDRQSEGEDDTEEVDWQGKTVRVPKDVAKDIRDGAYRQADYTRKTQETAQHRRDLEAYAQSLEAERGRITEQAKADEADFKDRARMAALDEQLEQYTPEVWRALQQNDAANGTNETQAHLLRVRTLEAQKGQLSTKIGEAKTKRELDTQQATARQTEEARAAYVRQIEEARPVLVKEIGWSPELAKKTEDFGKSQGLTDQELGIMATDPRFVKLVHFARIGHDAVQKQKQAVGQSRTASQPTPTPVDTVRPSRSPSATKAPSDRDSPEVWLKKRRQQVADKEVKRA